jgi:hypothetical protein
MTFYRKSILPRLFFPSFYLHSCLLYIYSLYFKQCKFKKINSSSKILISAGIKGWESIEFKELLQSAIEYLNNDNQVIQHKISQPQNYYIELKEILNKEVVTHAFYDPRSGSQKLVKGFIESVKISFLFCKFNVVPIVMLADISHRIQRIKGAIVSANFGIAISFVSTKIMSPIFPHNRLFGPLVMPFSCNTLDKIEKLEKHINSDEYAACFIGSLYEPRITLLNNIKEGLLKFNLNLEIKGRGPSGQRRPDQEYWETLTKTPIIITTSDQILSTDLDWAWTPSLVYRYLEALTCGSLLVAPKVPTVQRYFVPQLDFISFESPEEAVEKIVYYFNNKQEAKKIAQNGHRKAKALIESKIFWLQIDFCLSKHSIF